MKRSAIRGSWRDSPRLAFQFIRATCCSSAQVYGLQRRELVLQRVAAGARVRLDLEVVVARRRAVADRFARGRSFAAGDLGPGAAIPLVQIQIEVRVGGAAQLAGDRARTDLHI